MPSGRDWLTYQGGDLASGDRTISESEIAATAALRAGLLGLALGGGFSLSHTDAHTYPPAGAHK